VLQKLVHKDGFQHVLLVGDDVAIPAIRSCLHPTVEEKVRDVLRMETIASEHEILKASLEAMRRVDERHDTERASRLIDEYRAGGLAVAGLQETLSALSKGQVNELVIDAEPAAIDEDEELAPELIAELNPDLPPRDTGQNQERERLQAIADLLVTKAQQTSARVSFVEDSQLLANVGGVGAFLRYKI
jgi:peptide subunit release factor 1 (eRF1)